MLKAFDGLLLIVVINKKEEAYSKRKKNAQFKTREQKTDPINDQNGKNRYPIYDQNGKKIISFGTAHTYIGHIGK